MRRFWIAAITIVICASAAGVASAQSKKAAKPTALIPFEIERAKDYPVRLPRLCTVRLSRRLVPEIERRGAFRVFRVVRVFRG